MKVYMVVLDMDADVEYGVDSWSDLLGIFDSMELAKKALNEWANNCEDVPKESIKYEKYNNEEHFSCEYCTEYDNYYVTERTIEIDINDKYENDRIITLGGGWYRE